MEEKKLTMEERDVLGDLFIVMAALFEEEASQVTTSLGILGSFDSLLSCLLCKRHLGISLKEVVDIRMDGGLHEEIEQAKSEYMKLPKNYN